ncbi:MAG: hypothetical protein JW913_11585 [Chitinispirillaceae bacterium]|nr:hypothetical protein [Chitinispirillaceae bacterium]
MKLNYTYCRPHRNRFSPVGRTESSGTSSLTKLRSTQRVLMTDGGTITSMHIYHAGTGAQIVVGIYDDNAGSPGTLLTRSGIMGVEIILFRNGG